MSTEEQTEREKSEKHDDISSSESIQVYKNFDDSGVRSPSSVQDIQQLKSYQQNLNVEGEPSSPGSHSKNKEHSSKKPPSHGTSWFGLLPSFTTLFRTQKYGEAQQQQHHKTARRHSEPSKQASSEKYSAIGKSTSYSERLPTDTNNAIEQDNHTNKENNETVSENLGQTSHKQETMKNETKTGIPRGNIFAESALDKDSAVTLPTNSDDFVSSKSKTRGISASKSIDEFLNKIAHPRRHSVTKERNSFESTHTSQTTSLSSGENTPSSSHSRSRSSSLIGNLRNRSENKDSKFIVPVTGARQLRPHEISRHKYLECLKNKLVPTEFVYAKPAEEVLLIGDWLEWDSIPLQWDEEKGLFRLVVDLPVGEHEFRYVVTPKQENFDDSSKQNSSQF